MSTVLTLPLDPTGKATTNDITGEVHAIGTTKIRALAPNYGAFFASTLVVTDVASGQKLTSAQYFAAVVYDLATTKYGKPNADTICGVVVILDPAVSANVKIDYQALGAGYQTPQNGIVADLLQAEPDTRPTKWPSVIDSLQSTPVSAQYHDIGQAGMITFEYVVHTLQRMTQLSLMGDPISQDAIKAYADAQEQLALGPLNTQMALLAAHEADRTNPHQLMAHQLGAYTQAEETAAIAVEHTAMQAGDAALVVTLNTHEANTNNPHQVTLVQLGMYATSTVNSNISAAQTAITSTISTNATTMNAHINNLNNPHQDSTTGLGTLTISQIQTAITNATTPVSTEASADTTTLNTHIANKANPHVVTPAQIGTWTASALASLQTTLNNHIANTANPHAVNISQISGYTANQFNAALSAAQTAYQNYFNSNYNVMWGHINNRSNPHGTSAQYHLGALGPWNLGQLEADLNWGQGQINNSGFAFYETGTQYYNVNYSGACGGNFGRDLLIYQGTSPVITGGDNTVTGNWTWFNAPGGAQVQGFYRWNNVITVIVLNGSLDGMTFSSSLGDNFTLSNSWSYSWLANGNGVYTAYGAYTGVWQGGPRSGYCHISGWPQSGQPPAGYINGQPPPPPPVCTGGGTGSHCSVSCFVAGSRVLMGDYTWQPIESLVPGDLLMTPTGPAKMLRLHEAILGTGRKMLTMKEDPHTRWVADHPLWSRPAAGGKQWWWSGDAAYMRAEVEGGLTQGLKDINSVYEGEVEYAHLNGFVKRTVVELDEDPMTPVYIPVLEGPPCIVNGYVAAAFFNEWNYDYEQLDWRFLHQAHAAGERIARAEVMGIAA
jgi:hypothetical protein